jgi:hypothetical protein
MGSARRRNSTGLKAGAAHSSRRGNRHAAADKPEPPQPDIGAILGRFSDALSFVATATHVLIAAQDRTDVETPYDASETVHTLMHGLNALRGVYNALDVARRHLP